ncbi:glycine--tRNA ligase-like protein [Dinothrombium tinctorium]|uniref:glycine--tRNA ligase n=1 Tax=Dinothrombium tinctorium TaxID=1965070 RepID=A0A3S3PYE5_9ACAR|nr:glycine--tRNA ligase-like protein [Dinothrombium tinctorium]RWS00129.1 glycine--tRNA ligase-like protein [Dinothrombium tinctorium]RWS02145.1 glycine--tRNA ligase-like protein [Dinothrombium tinctorium]
MSLLYINLFTVFVAKYVKDLKAANASDEQLKLAFNDLQVATQNLERQRLLVVTSNEFRKYLLDDLLYKHYFFSNSFEIYGGLTRFYDFGPLGAEIEANLIECWKKHFIIEEKLLQLKSPSITPEAVFRASGHLKRFTDFCVKDTKTGKLFRVDHLIKDFLHNQLSSNDLSKEIKSEYLNVLYKLNNFSKDELNELRKKFDIKSPHTGNPLTDVFEMNLMFGFSMKHNSKAEVYLRPELSQSAFINFKKLFSFNKSKLPFGVAQIGSAYRNELSSGTGITRLREFTLAEIQHFFDPNEYSHPKFKNVEEVKLNLYSACNQMENKDSVEMSVKEAVNKNILSENMAYFLARIHLFMLKIGIDPRKLRFRQHMNRELAHYAVSCWDAECLTFRGWLECVGCSDRSCNDIKNHLEASKAEFIECISSTNSSNLKDFVDECSEKDNECEGFNFEKTLPCVIEPSFGIERLLYSIFDHNFCFRKDDERKAYLSLPLSVAPVICCVLPLGSNYEFHPLLKQISDKLHAAGITYDIDDTRKSIGKRYVRSDEIGIPFAVTIDFDSLIEPHSVTLRERDSIKQVRVPVNNLIEILKNLSTESISFEQIEKLYPQFKGQVHSKETIKTAVKTHLC